MAGVRVMLGKNSMGAPGGGGGTWIYKGGLTETVLERSCWSPGRVLNFLWASASRENFKK